MRDVIGVRRQGEAHITFATTNHPLIVGQEVTIETPLETFSATVTIAPDQLPAKIPAVMIAGSAHPSDDPAYDGPTEHSSEDEGYRARKVHFPALGEQQPDGVVIRINLRHETFDLQNDRGEIDTVSPTTPENPGRRQRSCT